MSTRMAPVSVDRINNEVYVGQLLFPTSVQSAVNFAVAQGVPMDVIVPQGYTGGESIEAITGGSAQVNIIDERGGQRQPYLWYQNAYLPEPMTQRGGISSFQLNHYLFVGVGRLTTIASAIAYAVQWGGSYFILITTVYTGTEVIGELTGANERIFLSDQRTDEIQNYHWDGTRFVATPLVIPGDITVPGNLTVRGSTTLEGTLIGTDAEFDEVLVDSSPVRTFANTPDGPGEGMVWPPDGIGYSAGDHWAKTLAFDVPHFDDEGMSFGYAGGHGKIYVQPGAAGGGYDWYTVTPAGVKTLVAQFSSGQLRASALVATAVVGGDPVPNSIWMDNYGRAGRLITVGPSVNEFNGIDFVALDSNSSHIQPMAQLTWETSLNAAQFAVDYLKINRDTTFSGAVNIAGKLTTAQIENTGEFWTHLNNVGSIPGAGKNSGTVIGWNVPEGYGNTVFVNYNGSAGGGFRWFNVAPNTDIGPTTLPVMDLDFLSGLFLYGTQAALQVGPGYTTPAASNGTAGNPVPRLNLTVLGESGRSFPGEFTFRTWSSVDANSSGSDSLDITHTSEGPDGTSPSLLTLNRSGNLTVAGGLSGGQSYAPDIGSSRLYSFDLFQNKTIPTMTDIVTCGDGGTRGIFRIVGLGPGGLGPVEYARFLDTGIFLQGAVQVDGTFYANGAKNFRIPHPHDPENKWLIHSSFEGPEMGLIYRGESETVDGTATIELPAYFEALVLPDQRSVQITAIDDEDGTADFAMFKASRVREGQFTVKSSVPSVKFCWQVMAVRGDIPAPEIEPMITDEERERKQQAAEGKR